MTSAILLQSKMKRVILAHLREIRASRIGESMVQDMHSF